jgi:hypothetical protein
MSDVTGWLMSLDEDRFRAAVADDCHGRADEELSAALRDPKVCRRWLAVLRLLLADANAQFAQKKGDLSPEAEAWRRKALRWQERLIARRDEARRVASESHHATPEARAASDRERRRRGEAGDIAVRRLIDRHRDEFDAILTDEFEAAGLELPLALQSRRLDRERVTAAEAMRVLREAGALH